MKFINCEIDECIHRNQDRDLYVFGAGANISFFESSDLKRIKGRVKAVIDNREKEAVSLFGTEMPVFKPEYLIGKDNISVIITTSVYMTEMYEQLEEMCLPDSVEVYIYPLMTLQNDHRLSESERRIVFGEEKKQRIPQIIHAFWFSETQKPEEYQKCINSWRTKCPEFEIREYNMKNYDVEKHPFLKRAFDVGAWAYATDYARLDVLSQEGGVYMDMDVEVLKPFTSILGHEGVFSFFSDGSIDLAAFMVSKDNPLPQILLQAYDDIPLPENKKEFERYYQPLQVMRLLEEYGIEMNGKFQQKNGNIFLPRYLMMPLDCAIYEMNDNEDTFMVHRANAGWKEESYAAKKAERNRAFYEEITNQ